MEISGKETQLAKIKLAFNDAEFAEANVAKSTFIGIGDKGCKPEPHRYQCIFHNQNSEHDYWMEEQDGEIKT